MSMPISRDRLDHELWSRLTELPVRNPLSSVHVRRIIEDRGLALERAVGPTVDFLPFSFLTLGVRRGRAVARIDVRKAGPEGLESLGTGTGFLIAPFLLLTNNHVLPDLATAKTSVAQFNYELDLLGNETAADPWKLDPDRFFFTSPFAELDFTLVGVERRGTDEAGAAWSTIPLRASRAKVQVGERVSIIQHPEGRRKEVVLHESKVSGFLDGGFIHYTADTLVGSSGAPVFNDQWDLVALHHRGLIRRDPSGRPIFENGDYVCDANEGVRVSAIVEHLQSSALPAAARPLIEPFLYE